MVSKCETAEVIRNELARYDVDFHFDNGGRRPFVRITRNGLSRKVAYSKSGAGSRGVQNARADVRAKLRELGAQEKART